VNHGGQALKVRRLLGCFVVKFDARIGHDRSCCWGYFEMSNRGQAIGLLASRSNWVAIRSTGVDRRKVRVGAGTDLAWAGPRLHGS
jgi:hypothetical protein